MLTGCYFITICAYHHRGEQERRQRSVREVDMDDLPPAVKKAWVPWLILLLTLSRVTYGVDESLYSRQLYVLGGSVSLRIPCRIPSVVLYECLLWVILVSVCRHARTTAARRVKCAHCGSGR